MASKSFIDKAQAELALQLLKKEGPQATSRYLGDILLTRLGAHPKWRDVHPILLGSWARGELCAKSDIDLLFIGNESVVGEFVRDLQNEGIKIRSRCPEDMSDWTRGVEAFDVLALIDAKAVFPEDELSLSQQQQCVLEKNQSYFKKVFATIMAERGSRAARYDSISSYLEPNIKYGQGALRDLEQGLMIYRLFQEKFNYANSQVETLIAAKNRLLSLRHFLHLSGAGDVFVAPLQNDAAKFFNNSTAQEFMSLLESTLADVSFYADWIAEVASSRSGGLQKLMKHKISNLNAALLALKKDASVMMQERVRQCLQIDFENPKNKKSYARELAKYFHADMSPEFAHALFRSGLMAHLVPDLNRLKGHVQHDQYHRYSVDAHTFQAVREVLRVKKRPKMLGSLSKIVKNLTASDWEILLWTALYHDLGKGLKKDHAAEGKTIVMRDLVKLGASLKVTTQVAWMVENHLLISGAAFRKNPNSQATWAELFSRGLRGNRIANLSIFTAIDIRATNPDAWNDWKEHLLFDLFHALQTKRATYMDQFLGFAQRKNVKLSKDFINGLDPQVIENLPHTALVADYKALKKLQIHQLDMDGVSQKALPALVLVTRKKEMWIRLHAPMDKPGLFLQFVSALFAAGLSIQEAFVQTYKDYGAYDWFKVKSTKSVAQVKNLLTGFDLSLAVASQQGEVIRFAVIELVSEGKVSSIISFRGRDQRGALLAAARALYAVGFEIESAKVHTWGRQIDDVFTVKTTQGMAEKLLKLRELCLA